MHTVQTYRRDFLKKALVSGLALSSLGAWSTKASTMKLGLVTYLWGKDWLLPELIANCEKNGISGSGTANRACTWSRSTPEQK